MATYAYDLATDVGKVRLKIGDTDISPTTDAIFSDEEIEYFLNEGGNIVLASALALETIAASSTRIAKLIKSLNYTEDTRAAAQGLLHVAARMREIEQMAPAGGYAEQAVTPEASGQIVANYWARTNG